MVCGANVQTGKRKVQDLFRRPRPSKPLAMMLLKKGYGESSRYGFNRVRPWDPKQTMAEVEGRRKRFV